MRLLLDTNVLSELRRYGTRDEHPATQGVVTRILREQPSNLFTSVIVYAEVRKGIEKLRTSKRKRALDTWSRQLPEQFGHRLLPIDEAIAEHWGRIQAEAEAKGRRPRALDGLLAATALRHGLTLATRNTADFEFLGVPLLDPWRQ